jgi:hypothetical protein
MNVILIEASGNETFHWRNLSDKPQEYVGNYCVNESGGEVLQ